MGFFMLGSPFFDGLTLGISDGNADLPQHLLIDLADRRSQCADGSRGVGVLKFLSLNPNHKWRKMWLSLAQARKMCYRFELAGPERDGCNRWYYRGIGVDLAAVVRLWHLPHFAEKHRRLFQL